MWHVIYFYFHLGVLRFAGIFPQYYESALPIMFEAAKSLINRGTWHTAFVGEYTLSPLNCCDCNFR